jgi:L-fuculose-phosphate aldolase
MEGKYYLPLIPVITSPKATFGSAYAAEHLAKLMKEHRAVIIRGHGCFTAGKTIEEATMLATVLESICRINYLA